MYPRRIESLDTLQEVDENGFNGPQKVALQNAWRIIKTQASVHSTNIFLSFFGTYPRYFSVFEKRGKGKDNELLHAHPSWVISLLGKLIEGIWDSSKFNAIVQAFVKRHKRRLLKQTDIACMVDVINKYFKQVLDIYMTRTLSSAIDNLCHQLVANYV